MLGVGTEVGVGSGVSVGNGDGSGVGSDGGAVVGVAAEPQANVNKKRAINRPTLTRRGPETPIPTVCRLSTISLRRGGQDSCDRKRYHR